MRVGNVQIFEDALDGAVLAERTVQRVEGDIGLEFSKTPADIASNVDAGDGIAFASSASAQELPEDSDTGRSDENPPISTATCFFAMKATPRTLPHQS